MKQSLRKKWCMDFTYVALKDGTFRYKCTIIDLFDRSVIASENSRKIRQSMSRAGYPYDNAPMERYFNTLKTELLNVRSPLCSIIIGCRC